MSERSAPGSSNATPSSTAVVAFPCRTCGSKLQYAPGTEDLCCTHCGATQPIAVPRTAVEEQDYRAQLDRLRHQADTVPTPVLKCRACGANVSLPEHVTASACPFCNTDLVATTAVGRAIRPAAMLPFRVTREDATTAFRRWLGKLWFAPNALRRAGELLERLAGMYVPYWTYDCHTVTHYAGSRGEHYWVTVGTGKNRRRVQRTRWYPAGGTVYNTFDDVLVLASHALPHGHAQELEPWGLHELVPYDDAYVSGFGAEHYQVDLAEGFDLARGLMAGTIHTTICQHIGGDVQRVSSSDTHYNDISYKHILLPMWISAYRFHGRVYRFLVNARTGEVQGERPWSWIKIAATAAVGAAIVGTIVFFASR